MEVEVKKMSEPVHVVRVHVVRIPVYQIQSAHLKSEFRPLK